jgi:proteasome accessory factor C
MARNRRGQATDNLMLLLALVPFVLDRGEVSVAEAAQQFERSEDDIIRSVLLIACAGIPGENLAYSHLDLFDIDWELFEKERIITFWNTVAIDHRPRFSTREASALLAGLQYLQSHPSYSGRSDLGDVMQKIHAGSRQGAPQPLGIQQPVVESHLTSLAEAIAENQTVDILYHNKRGESGVRTIDPLIIESRDDVSYLRGWCHQRQALRTFRVDRIESVVKGLAPRGDHGSLVDDISPNLFEPSPEDIVVTVQVALNALPLIADYLPRGFVPEKGVDPVVVDIAFAHYGSLTRCVASHPEVVHVMAPASARAAVVDFAEQALVQYQKTER